MAHMLILIRQLIHIYEIQSYHELCRGTKKQKIDRDFLCIKAHLKPQEYLA